MNSQTKPKVSVEEAGGIVKDDFVKNCDHAKPKYADALNIHKWDDKRKVYIGKKVLELMKTSETKSIETEGLVCLSESLGDFIRINTMYTKIRSDFEESLKELMKDDPFLKLLASALRK